MATSDPHLSAVVPCYNEEQVLPELHRRLAAACAAAAPSDYEIVLVNDGSRDGTWAEMLKLADRDARVVLVNLSRNHGHQLALTAGLSVCRGRRVLIIDADLQDPPELLPAMMSVMDGGADVVYGQRVRRAGETIGKRATAAIFYRLIERLTETPIPRDTGDFRLLSRRALDVFLAMPERHRFVRGMISWIGFRQEPVRYERAPRAAGVTKYPFGKMLRFAMDAVTAFSVKPLALASVVGVCSGGFALVLLAFSIASWLFGGQALVAGWTSLMAGVALLGAVQLFVLGIIGEYLGRLYEQSKGRPLFVIDQVVRGGRTDADARAAGAPRGEPAREVSGAAVAAGEGR
jgi:dolichol-phosphate mannosyltransferase